MTAVVALLIALPALLNCAKPSDPDDPGARKKDIWAEMSQGEVETYPYASILRPSTRFTAKVVDKMQFVYPTTEQHLCTFGCSDSVTVCIDSPAENIKSAVIRPIAKNAKWKLENGRIYLRMAPKDRYVVEINGATENTLLIFANPLQTEKPSRDDPDVIFFEAGKVHDSGKITVTSGQTVYLEGGCFVNGYIYAFGAENVKVLGPGIINCFPGNENALYVKRCNGVEMKDFLLLNTSAYGIVTTETDNIEADNVKSYACASTLTESGVENDSFDIHSGCNINIRHCFCYCHDDAYCIKTEKWQFKGVCDNILYEDCIGWNVLGGNTFEIGWETGYDVSNVTYRNIYSVHSARYGSNNVYRKGAVTIHNMARGTVSGIRYENVYIEDPLVYGLCFRIANSGNVNIGDGITWSPGIIRDVKMKNVHIAKLAQTKFGNGAEGYDKDHTIDVEIEDLYIDGKRVDNLKDAGFTTNAFANIKIK